MHRITNLQDPIQKTVGRRVPADPLSLDGNRKADARAWADAFPTPAFARGAYRFSSHEEADRWIWSAITNPTTAE